ncbi:hypothetical protein P872_16130 [Rhodonellum psychrophilum GCM71 = DSM 17998]|uniref:Uncharacterized protein n=1 Tax=Rhodonellum psychrophilum GCM71 = DSM 17998 TaxID=1123057 RepID=U5C395_9BACT|nr:hypothetical protein P872_16130 [Rhodonellum psychrophilum GCM71 = DSM 17998]
MEYALGFLRILKPKENQKIGRLITDADMVKSIKVNK